MDKKIANKLISAIEDHQQTLFEHGHDFWYCDASDTNDRGVYKPFRYYQTNRIVSMSTCGNCQKLIQLRREIRSIQKAAGLELTPLITNYTEDKAVKNISVKNKSEFNPNYSYA